MSWGVRRIEDESIDPTHGGGRRSTMTVGEWLDSVAVPQGSQYGAKPASYRQDAAGAGSLEGLDRKLEELNQRLKRLSDHPKPAQKDRRGDREMSRNYRSDRSTSDRDARGPRQHERDPLAVRLDQIDRRLADLAKPRIDDTSASMRVTDLRADGQQGADAERLRQGLREIERLQATLMEGLNERNGKPGQAIERYLQEERDRTSRFMSPVAETITRLEAEVRGLRKTVESRMEPPQAAFEDSDLQDIRRMLHRVAEIGTGRQDSVHIERLFEEMNRLRDVVVETGAKTLTLATAKSTQESRLADMVERLASVATSAQEKTSDDMRGLERRLADIADRMADVEGRGASSRDIAELQNAINGIAAKLDRPLPVAKPVIPAGLIDLDIRIEKLSDKLDRFEPITGNPRQMASLETEIAALRLDLAHSASRTDTGAFGQQISALGERIDRLASTVQSSGLQASSLDKFETRIGDLVDMIDRVVGSETTLDKHVGALQGEVAALRRDLSTLGGPQRNSALEEQMRMLAERLEKAGAKSADPAVLAKIDDKISRLTDLVQSAERPPAETNGIEIKLAKLELLLADHRDDTMEAASAAAREAVREFATFAADARQSDESMREIETDLRRVQDATRTNEARTSDALQSVHDALTTIVSRLGAIERVASERPVERIIERVPEPKMPEQRPIDPRMAESRLQGRESDEAVSPDRVGAPKIAPDDLPTQPRQMSSSSAAGGTPAARAPDVAQPRPEDHRPLEPGSGKPRVAPQPVVHQNVAQVAQAPAAERASQAAPQPQAAPAPRPAVDHGQGIAAQGGFAQGPARSDGDATGPKRNDFIAAARRAALAASQPATGAPPIPGQRADIEALETEAPAGGKSMFGSLFKGKQKTLILAGVGMAAAATGVAFVTSSAMHVAPIDQMPTASISATTTTATAPKGLPLATPDTNAASIALQPPSRVTSTFSPAKPSDEAARQSSLAEAMKQSAMAQGINSQPIPAQVQPSPERMASIQQPSPPDAAQQRQSPIGTTVVDTSATDPALAPAKPADISASGPLPLPPEKIGSLALRRAAANGDAKAQFEVGMRFSEGRGVPADMHEASTWFERAAVQNFEPAAYRLGSAYEKGLGVDRNALEAKRWYRIAAEGGNIRAMHNLGVLYANDHDMPSALQWFQKAADAGLKDSQFNLGIVYALGSGVKQDLAVSYKWFALGAAQGDQEAARKRDDIATHLDHTALAAAKLAVSTWRPMPISREANEETAVWSEPAASAPAHTADAPHPPEGWNKVMQAQAALQGKGLYAGKVDGELTPETKAAIRAFQKKSGLKQTGELDNALVGALMSKPL